MTVDDESAINFVRNNENIKKIHFKRDILRDGSANTFSLIVEVLQNEFCDKWNITEHAYDLLLEEI